jgi:uncharacterized membrane protein
MNFNNLKSIIKGYFLAGLLVLGPIFIVLIVFQWVFGGLLSWIEHGPMLFIVNDQNSDIAGFVRFLIMIGILLGGVLFVSMIGFFSRLYFGKKVFEWLKEGIEKIPLFGPIYSSLDQLFKAISSGGGKQFNRVVYLEYPRKDVWTVAFVTGQSDLRGIPPGYLNVYVPTVPNPTSGFFLMVKETEVKDSGLKVDEAFKMILSLGVAMPGHDVAPKDLPQS